MRIVAGIIAFIWMVHFAILEKVGNDLTTNGHWWLLGLTFAATGGVLVATLDSWGRYVPIGFTVLVTMVVIGGGAGPLVMSSTHETFEVSADCSADRVPSGIVVARDGESCVVTYPVEVYNGLSSTQLKPDGDDFSLNSPSNAPASQVQMLWDGSSADARVVFPMVFHYSRGREDHIQPFTGGFEFTTSTPYK